MKKIILALILCTFLVFSLACNDSGASTSTDTNTNNAEQQSNSAKAPESEHPFPTGASEVGGKKIVICTATGTSEDGNIPAELLDENTIMSQIGMDLGDFDNDDLCWDGNLEIFIYVNEIFLQREQTAYFSQTTIDLEDWMLLPGEYTVTAVQFENDDPTGNVVNLSTARYKIKN